MGLVHPCPPSGGLLFFLKNITLPPCNLIGDMLYYVCFPRGRRDNKDNRQGKEKMSKFNVTMTRTETYSHSIEIEAESAEEAEKIASERELENEFYDKWGLPDDVETHYTAEEIEDPNRTYTLSELAEKVDIDSWVEGISAMCAMDAIRKEVYDMAGMVEDEDNPICPAEFETEYTELSNKYGFRFNRKGEIVSFYLTKK